MSGTGIDTLRANGLGGNDIFVHTDLGRKKKEVHGKGERDSVALNGGAGVDQLIDATVSTDAPGTEYRISGANAGEVAGTNFSSIEQLTGGLGGDTFAFVGAGYLSGRIDGGDGDDRFNYAERLIPVSVNMSRLTATGTTGFSNIEGFTGSAASSDLLTGFSAANTWDLSGVGSGNINAVLTFASFERLAGGGSEDVFHIAAGAEAVGTISAGGGSDTLVFATWTDPVWVDFRTRTATGLTGFTGVESVIGGGGIDSLHGGDANTTWTVNAPNTGSAGSTAFSSFERLLGGTGADNFVMANASAAVTGLIDGGSGNNTLTAAAVANVWQITGIGVGDLNGLPFTGLVNLTGGSAADTFVFGEQGSLTGTVNGGTGSDVLDHTGLPGVLVDLQARTTSRLGGFLNIERVQGSATGTDTLIGPDATTNWTIDAVDGGTAGSTQFASFEDLRGGSGNDRFTFANTWAFVSGSLNGGEGTDTVAGAGMANAWSITDFGGGTLNALPFADVENLTGGTAADSFAFGDTGEIAGILNGGGGSDSLSYAAMPGPITVDLATRTGPWIGSFTSIESTTGTAETGDLLVGANATTSWSITAVNAGTVGGMAFSGFESLLGGTGNDTFTLANPTAGVSGQIDGDAGIDTFVGSAADSSWLIDAVGGGQLTPSAAGNEVHFVGIENITGGSQDDYFRIAATGQLAGRLNGGLGNNVLSYETWTASVAVDLQTGVATAVTGLVSNITVVLGGAGDDVLTSPTSRGAVLVGNAGNDTLAGGGVRNLLIGGDGSDVLSGSGGDDLLVAGRTAFDLDANALFAIFGEWSTTARDYVTRANNIRGALSGGLNGSYFLKPLETVFSDSGASDQLTGGTGRDWFYAELDDLTIDRVTSGSLLEFVDSL